MFSSIPTQLYLVWIIDLDIKFPLLRLLQFLSDLKGKLNVIHILAANSELSGHFAIWDPTNSVEDLKWM